MKAKKVSGNYLEVWKTLGDSGCLFFIDPKRSKSDTLEEAQSAINRDIVRTAMIGSPKEKNNIRELWLNSQTRFFCQGDETGANFVNMIFYCNLFPKGIMDSEVARKLQDSQVELRFSYINNLGQASGISVFGYTDHPSHWVICVITNASADRSERLVNLYFSQDAYKLYTGQTSLEPKMFDRQRNYKDYIELQTRMSHDNSIHRAHVDVNLFEDLREVMKSPEIFDMVKSVITSKGTLNKANINIVDSLSANFPNGNEYDENYWAMNIKLMERERLNDGQGKEVYSHLMELCDRAYHLNNSGHRKDADIALSLAKVLKEKCDNYFSSPGEKKELDDFQKQCVQLINEAKPKLMHYEGWSKLLVNLLLAILSVGIIYAVVGAIKYHYTGNFFWYNPPSKCYLEMEKTEEALLNINRLSTSLS